MTDEAKAALVRRLQAAVGLHRSGQTERAEHEYRAILAEHPEEPDALHFLGVLRAQRGDVDEGIKLIRRSLKGEPDHPDAHNNLANLLRDAGHPEDAMDAYRECLRLNPDFAPALLNLGNLLLASGRDAEALETFRRAVTLRPEHGPSLLGLGRALLETGQAEEALEPLQLAAESADVDTAASPLYLGRALLESGRTREAIRVYRKGIRAHARVADKLYLDLGKLYEHLGMRDEARQLFERWLEMQPDNPVPEHLLASLRDEAPPARASDAYLVRTFDDFADTFDSVLGRLEYGAPERVCNALLAMLGDDGGEVHVLDAGCGTGLCGPLLRERAHRLTGVDLSPKMIEQARKRGCYDNLEVAELTHYLAAHPGSLDAVVSADTLCYFGDLAPVFAAMRDALEGGGCFAFTVERAGATSDQGDWTLTPSGRYAHRVGYLKRALGEAGLRLESCVPTVLRLEAGEDVQGYIVTGRKP